MSRVFAGLDYEIAVSRAPGDCTRLAREAAQTGEEYRIYACGGDGTLNEVVCGAAGAGNVAVTAFSGGSGNDFIRIFSDPAAFSDPERLKDAQEAEFDLIRCNDHLALNVCSVGFDARIGTDIARYKRLPLFHGFRAYVASTVVNLIKGVTRHYRVDIDGRTVDGPMTMICVCNGRFYGGGFNPIPEAEPDDGLLDVLLVEKVTRLQVPGVIGKYKSGRYKELTRYTEYCRTDHLTIFCDEPNVINLDGEARLDTRMDISVAEEKIRFFYPRGLTWRAAQ